MGETTDVWILPHVDGWYQVRCAVCGFAAHEQDYAAAYEIADLHLAITRPARGHRRRGHPPPSVGALPLCRASVMTSHRPATGAGGVRRDCFPS
jgi:hypothetical protein